MNFFKTYSVYLVVAVVLVVGFFALNDYAYERPKELDKRITEVTENLQELMNSTTSQTQRRDAIMDAIFKEEELAFRRALAEHLAEALLLAAVMILFIEGPTRYMAAKEDEAFVEKISNGFRQQANEISSNVWNAIFRKLVPDAIAIEIQKILKSDVCRIRPDYVITISDNKYSGLGENEIVVRRQLSYRLKNLTNDVLNFPLTFEIRSRAGDKEVSSEDGQTFLLPRIVEVGVGGKNYPIDPNSRLQFKQTVQLPAMTIDAECWEIYSDAEEFFGLKDRVLYVMTQPTAGIEVLVVNNSRNVFVGPSQVYLTSGPQRLRSSMEGRWSYDGGLLPGTGLSIAWEPVPPNRAHNVPGITAEKHPPDGVSSADKQKESSRQTMPASPS